MEILCFFAGMAFVLMSQGYSLILLCICLYLQPSVTLVGWFIMAIIWTYGHLQVTSDFGMPSEAAIKRPQLQGVISSIPIHSKGKVQFQFSLHSINDTPAKSTVLLSCYNHCPSMHPGEEWRFQAKLKRPRNLGNPGSFNVVHWLHARHISWTGYIKTGTLKRISTSIDTFKILRVRAYLAHLMENSVTDKQIVGVWQALAIGMTYHLDKNDWDLFRKTGTTHLMVISGAHIGLVAGLTFLFIRYSWSFCPIVSLYWPAQKVASIAALSLAGIYALLAGFGVPAQRALIVCFFMTLKYFSNHRVGAWQAWRYALLAILVYEPHSIFQPGFYLSFTAVAIIILVNQRINSLKWIKNLAIQVACLVGLMPMTLYWFSYGAVNGLIANLLAIPFMGFIIIPLALINIILLQGVHTHWLLLALTHSISGLLYYLSWVDQLSFVNVQAHFNHFIYPLEIMISLWIMTCIPVTQLKIPALVLMIAAVFPKFEKIKPGEAKITVLDVGQGLAVWVQTANHRLLYDTGVKFYQGSDMGELAVLPYLNHIGIKSIDKIVISHSDSDHRGGLLSILKKYRNVDLIVDDPKFYHLRSSSCQNYPSWVWDGIKMQFFPLPEGLKGKNNHSCVLKVSSSASSMLLAGDIEKNAETLLVKHYNQQLQSTALIVPHHGSKTSSSQRFLDTVAPQFAIMSYGFDNRYHFPHASVLSRYQQSKIKLFNTVDDGMITFYLYPDRVSAPQGYLDKVRETLPN